MKASLFFRFWLIAAVFSGMGGCGYTTQSALPARLKTICVEPFVNNIDYTASDDRQIYFPLLEVKVRNAIIDRFLFDGNLRVAEKDQADLVLSGELIRYERYALRYTDNDDVQEYRVHVIVNLVMKDCRQNEVFWEESGFAGEATYFVSGAMATTESSALEEATVDLARRVVERTIENW